MVEMVDNPTDGASNPGGHYHGSEMDNIVKAANGLGVLLHTYDMTVLGSDRVVTIPAFDAWVPDGSGASVFVNKSSATNVTISAAASNPATDIITLTSAGVVAALDGTPTAEVDDVEEAPEVALPADSILLCKVRRVADQTNVLAADVVGRAIDVGDVNIKELWIPQTAEGSAFGYTGQIGDFPISIMAAADISRFVFRIPDDFSLLVTAVVEVSPDATETVQWDVATDFAADGEARTTHSGSLTDSQLAVTADQLAGLDVSGALTGIAAGDFVGMAFTSDTTSLLVLGLFIKYR